MPKTWMAPFFVATIVILAPAPARPLAWSDDGGQQQIAITLQDQTKPPRLAVPPFVAPPTDTELSSIARSAADVLWADLDFESEFNLVSKEAAQQIPLATSIASINYARWSELGADVVVFATTTRNGTQFDVALQLVGVRGADATKVLFASIYHCTIRSPRTCSHFIADDMHKRIRQLNGVAQTRLAFTSDRSGAQLTGRFTPDAGVAKEIYISDYDGANQQAITANHSLNVAPAWSPDGRFLAYTSWVTHFPDIFVKSIYEAREATRPAGGTADIQNQLAAWSPDGTKIAFASQRDGQWDIFVMNRDGGDLRNLTHARAGVVNNSPTWSPTGMQIAFTSNRTGSNQIYVMNADGTGVLALTSDVKADHPTWSPAPFNDIAYTASRPGSGHDVGVIDVATRQVRILTEGIGDNEQPSFAPNGRHMAFTTTRFGKIQIAIIDRKGVVQRQITKEGTNTYPTWGNAIK